MLRVLVAEKHDLLRAALGALLDREAGLDVVSEVARGEDAVSMARLMRPSVAVIDMDLPDLDGVETTAQLRDSVPDIEVLVLTSRCSRGELERAVAAGARGVLHKDVKPARLVEAVREVGQSQHVFDPRLVTGLLRDRSQTPTTGELRVLGQVAAGSSIKEVASVLSLSPGTVRNYLSSVMTKTQARNRCDAIRIAREFGWLV
jgi:two-component system response regulator DesR